MPGQVAHAPTSVDRVLCSVRRGGGLGHADVATERGQDTGVTGKSVVDDGIRWDRMERERFDSLVEALLSRVHDREGHEVTFPEGKGGDGGRDAVAVADGRTIVYQFKFYVDGLATSGRSRQRAIKQSFNRARDHDPEEWVLVVPCKLTDAFRRYLRDLPKGTNVKVSCWDRPTLDSMFAAHPDLVALMKQDDLLTERARVLGQTALLMQDGLADAVAHRAATQSALSQMHPYWDVRMSEDSGGVPAFTFLPKTKNARELSPLGLRLQVARVDGDDPLCARLGDAESYGRPGVTTIPKDRIVEYVPVGLEWAGIHVGGPLPEQVELHVPSVAAVVGVPVTLRAYNSDGRLQSTFAAKATGGNRGTDGYSLVVGFFGCVELTLLMPEHSKESDAGAVRVQYDWPRDPATAARGTALLLALHEATSFELDLSGRPLAMFKLGWARGTAEIERLHKLHEFTTDLDRVQQVTETFFDVPEEIDDLDRIWLRCIRRMLDGEAVLIPRGSFTGIPEPELPADPVIAEDGLGAVVFDGGETLTLCGQQLPIPAIRCYHPAARIEGVAEAFADARSAHPQGLKFTFTATGNDSFLAFIPGRFTGNEVIASSWGLTGVPEPKPLPVTGGLGPGKRDPEVTDSSESPSGT